MPDLLSDFSTRFWSDFEKLKREDKKLGSKLFDLISDTVQHPENPFFGRGEPEALKYELSGKYSRRITDGHRLVYFYSEDKSRVNFISCFGHYTDL
jgi:toxin YoeB